MVDLRCCRSQFSAVEAVVFDKDGTLANSEAYLWKLGYARSRLLDQRCPGILRDLWHAFGMMETAVQADGLLASRTRQENIAAAVDCLVTYGLCRAEAMQAVTEAFANADQVMPDKSSTTALFLEAIPLLIALNAAGIRVGILSSDSTANVKAFVSQYDLNQYISVCLGTDGLLTKPDPALLNWACTQLGHVPQRTIMVGDSTADMAMAKAAGALGSIGVTWGWQFPCPPRQADAIAKRFDEIEVIDKML